MSRPESLRQARHGAPRPAARTRGLEARRSASRELAPAKHSPRLVVVAGLMASGKSTVARHLAQRLGAELVSADALREDTLRNGVSEAMVPGFSEKLYPRLLERARNHLRAGRSVVLDGAFRTRSRRAAARRLAAELGADFLLVECRATLEECRRRLAQREAREGRPGWLEMFEAFLSRWEPVQELPPELHATLDSSRPETALEGLETELPPELFR